MSNLKTSSKNPRKKRTFSFEDMEKRVLLAADVFGIQQQKQWIVDSNRDGSPDLRVNYGNTTDIPLPADYDGNGTADFAVLRDVDGQWQWLVDTDRNGAANLRTTYGLTSDIALPADYDGDGATDFAVLRDVNGQWEWIVDTDRDGAPNFRELYGNSTDIAQPADYDGDGATDFAVVRDLNGQWEWIVDTDRDGSPNFREIYGNSTDIAQPADYNGDGATDFAVLRDVNGQWEWIVDSDRDGSPDFRKIYGSSTDIAQPADYDGDGSTDFAVLRDVNGQWQWIVDTNRDGVPNLRANYGDTTDIAWPADYNGDGVVDFAVTRDIHYVSGSAWPELETAIHELVFDHLKANDIPGATIAISKNGRLVAAKSYGFRHAEARTRIEPFHRTRVGSVSKIITSLAAMKLTEQDPSFDLNRNVYGTDGLLSDPAYMEAIQKNIASQGDNAHPLEWFTNIKLVHLLSHSAGFAAADSVDQLASELGVPVNELTYKQVHLNFLEKKPLEHAPGAASNYNNHHIGVVGHIIESYTNQSYEEYVTQNILSPLGLDHIRLEDGVVNSQDSFAHQYIRIPYGDSTDFARPADYNGDGAADFAVLRAVEGQWQWIVDTERNGVPNLRINYGNTTDVALPADYDGDGATDFAVLRDVNGQWEWIVDTNRDGVPDFRKIYGDTTDIAEPADFNGDGATDFAVLRDVDGQWEWIVDTDRNGTPNFRTKFGDTTDVARPADYDGDGATDFAVLRDVNGQWEWIVDTNRDGVPDFRATYGDTTDMAQPADYNGDGATDFAVLRDVNGQWEWIVDTELDGVPDLRVKYGDTTDVAWPADYDGDGATDFAVLRDVNGQWQWLLDGNRDGSVDRSGVVTTLATPPNPLGFFAGGWTASAEDLVQLMLATDQNTNHPDILKPETLELMERSPFDTFSDQALGWARSSNGSLSHNGSLPGGYANIVKYAPGAQANGYDLGDINVAVLLNIQNGTGVSALTQALAVEAAKLEIVSDFDLREQPVVVGDSTHDGVFNSSDLVRVFQAGEYEDQIVGNSSFDEGDWNGDGDFNSSDLVFAFQAGTFVAAARPARLVELVDVLFAEENEKYFDSVIHAREDEDWIASYFSFDEGDWNGGREFNSNDAL